jgi:hypothetical protein
MDFHDGGHFSLDHNEAAMSPDSSKTKLQLPLSCDPPGPSNLSKQLVWIVSAVFSYYISYRGKPKVILRPEETAISLLSEFTKENIRPITRRDAIQILTYMAHRYLEVRVTWDVASSDLVSIKEISL